MNLDGRIASPGIPDVPATVALRVARVWRLRGKLERAAEGYRGVLRGDPNCVEAYVNLAEILAEQRRWDEVSTWCRRGLARISNIDQLHKLHITALIETGGVDHAFAHYRLSALTDPPQDLEPDAVLCCMVVRNEKQRLPFLLDYYRGLGVKRVFVVDNGSTDGTVDLLRRRPDVSLFASDLSFKEAAFGSAWFELLLRRHGLGHWVVLVDADEQLIYPGYQVKGLPELCRELEAAGKAALPAILLDMYGERPISESVCEPGRPLLEACPYFDREFAHERFERGGPYENMTIFFGGMRRRVFGAGTEYLVSKVPLLRYRRDTVLSNGQHLVSYPPEEVAGERGALLHFKYLSVLRRVRATRGRAQAALRGRGPVPGLRRGARCR